MKIYSYVKECLKKLFEIFTYFTKKVLEGEKRREFLIKTIGLVLFFPFIVGFTEIIVHNINSIISSYSKSNIFTKILLLIIMLIGIGSLAKLLLEFFFSFSESKKKKLKKLKKDNFIDTNRKILLNERLFVLMPYFWLLLELTVMMADDSVTFVEAYFPPNFGIFFKEEFLVPTIELYQTLPGLKFGILANFLFYIRYFYVGRSKEKFTYFSRYYYIQSILIQGLLNFVLHCYFLTFKYGMMVEYRQLLGLLIYSSFLAFIISLIIYISLGKESKYYFIHDALLYHIGRRKEKE
jgi:hypothetical protein